MLNLLHIIVGSDCEFQLNTVTHLVFHRNYAARSGVTDEICSIARRYSMKKCVRYTVPHPCRILPIICPSVRISLDNLAEDPFVQLLVIIYGNSFLFVARGAVVCTTLLECSITRSILYSRRSVNRVNVMAFTVSAVSVDLRGLICVVFRCCFC